MSFVAVEYFLLVTVGLLLYYIVPKKFQWIILLGLSYFYYLSFKTKAVIYIIATTLITYLAGILIETVNNKSKAFLEANKESLSKEEKKAKKNATKNTTKLIMIVGLLLIFGELAFVKYTNFAIEMVDRITHAGLSTVSLLVPIGISFFTFQSASYILDVYWQKVKAEKNPFKFALFVSFFPQIMQGPIGRFDRLSPQFFRGNKFDLTQIQFGLQRVFWGFLKKLLIADRASVYVNEVFGSYTQYNGIHVVIAVLLYSVWLYTDFSGGMDIVIGTAQMFGITMDENFKRPYFSKSIGEFWRRWHITLGAWMKDYIFYPFSLSKCFNKMNKFTKAKFGKQLGSAIPIGVANLLIFFIVGVWHGAALKYIAYGLYNGIIIAVSGLLKPVYKKGLEICHINGEGKAWGFVQILRTFILVNIGWFFDMAMDVSAAFYMMKAQFVNFSFKPLIDGSFKVLNMKNIDFIVIGIGCIMLLIIGILQEKGIHIRESVAKWPLPFRWVAYLLLVFVPVLFGYVGATQGFIYANF